MTPSLKTLRMLKSDEARIELEISDCERDREIARLMDEYAHARAEELIAADRAECVDEHEADLNEKDVLIAEIRAELGAANAAICGAADDLFGALHSFDGVIAAVDDALSIGDLAIIRARFDTVRENLET